MFFSACLFMREKIDIVAACWAVLIGKNISSYLHLLMVLASKLWTTHLVDILPKFQLFELLSHFLKFTVISFSFFLSFLLFLVKGSFKEKEEPYICEF
jgi:hypothetical protein